MDKNECNYFKLKFILGILIGVLGAAGIFYLVWTLDTNSHSYISEVPAKFLRSEQNDIIDTNFAIVSNCEGTESYRIPWITIEHRSNIGKIYIKENFTNNEYVFNDKEYKVNFTELTKVPNRVLETYREFGCINKRR